MALDSRLNLKEWGSQAWRLEHLYQMVDDEGTEFLFKMNEEQRELFENLHYLNLILKARQLGFTTLICLLALDMALFNSNKNIGITADTKDNAKKIFRNKILFPYNHLPEPLRKARFTESESAAEITFNNGSSIGVGVSLRSGTLQFLHVSEYGKISAKNPDKAKEIKTGSFNAVKAGQFGFVESTAEGMGGEFYELTQKSRKTAAMVAAGQAKLTTLDFRFHFFPWWRAKKYRMDPDGVPIDEAMKLYFAKLETQGIKLDAWQKAWYVKKADQQGDEMKREYPSTPEEPFEVAVAGAYFGKQMMLARKEGRICRVPYEPSMPVNTFWDLGVNDVTSIWFHQRVGLENRFLRYYEAAGMGLGHFVKYMQETDYIWGKHYLPHDVEVRMLGKEEFAKSRKEILEQDLKLKGVEVVPRIHEKGVGIELARNALASCYFDEIGCGKLEDRYLGGIAALENYKQEWDDKLSNWKGTPLHDWASNGSDAFMQFAQGYKPGTAKRAGNRERNWRTA